MTERRDRDRGRKQRGQGRPARGEGSRRGERGAAGERGEPAGRGGRQRGERRAGGRDRPDAPTAQPGRPPRPARARAPRPDLPRSVEPDLPRGVMKELERHVKDAADVARALTLAAEAVDADDPEAALPYLAWAKDVAPRAPSVREAHGIALYLAERWGAALSELQTYRRLSARTDQNHLIADCLRALDRPTAQVAETVEQMEAERDGIDRVAEGTIVWASTLADRGDPGAGRAVLRRILDRLPAEPEPTDAALRLWYVAGDLADRDGDARDARRWFEQIAAVDEELFDVAERLAHL